MRIDVITIFPEMFVSPLSTGLISKAIAKGIAEVYYTNPRDFTNDKHHKVDDEPYGGGTGMVMKPEPIFLAVESLPVLCRRQIILLTPQGERLTQNLLQELSTYNQLVLICGNYEGVDERVALHLADREISIGDYVLTCGEIPALVLINGVIRLLPGTVGKEESLKSESFQAGLLDYPQYTRPPNFRGWQVPEVLLSGNHQAIAEWRKQAQLEKTKRIRPDLLMYNSTE
ncbi:MAG: tRNA (guanosine(37)-N1)-methyltransferase TrmD [Pseudanabaenaceae cyanobacterium]